MKYTSLISPDQFVAMPWKNGLGSTVELLRKNLSDSEEFAWRLSMADVNADGAFSNFSGYDRCLLLLHGNGITLNTSSEQQIVLSDQLQAAEFKGDDRTVATLHDGPIKDFNVMTWRSCCHADVSSNVGQNEWSVQVVADELLIYAVENDLVILFDDHKQFCIPENHLFHVNNPVHGSVFMKGAPCIVVQIVYN